MKFLKRFWEGLNRQEVVDTTFTAFPRIIEWDKKKSYILTLPGYSKQDTERFNTSLQKELKKKGSSIVVTNVPLFGLGKEEEL